MSMYGSVGLMVLSPMSGDPSASITVECEVLFSLAWTASQSFGVVSVIGILTYSGSAVKPPLSWRT